MVVILHLNREEIDKLERAVGGYQDEGPVPEGWQSPLMEQTRDKVYEAVAEAQKILEILNA